ncbi:glycosyltransferase [Nocardioides zeae]|uniref:Glycosyltransferase n=1 Tax=Nocardioides imazamoxiresistens TaxID=3231893 RepID=A0ABU3Q178_9ACTN|nr:glycosyltransferase [Nocardioides zeae]MDT9595263.1 glycosyltransferase [Nocardioides zeae]
MSRPSRRRVALYSHDTQGLGHVRRNIEIAAALRAADPATDVLLLTGTPAAAALPLPPGTEVVVLPGIAKSAAGAYSAASLDLALDELLALRGAMIAGALGAFRPDLFVVDKVARGLGGELDGALRRLRGARGHGGLPTRVVLGLRDVLDTPEVARAEWDREATSTAVREWYDEVWVYGDPRVHDLVAAMDLPADVAAKVRHTGYLAHGRGRHVTPPAPLAAAPAPVPAPDADPYVLCLVGGGQDGHRLAETVARAALPTGHRAVVVTGPCMPLEQQERLHALAATRDDLEVRTFVRDPRPLVDGAAAVVTMGGYNTVCELLAAGRPTLVVPRVTPRREQLLRLQCLAPYTSLDHLEPDAATPERVGAWLAGAAGRGRLHHEVDLDGLAHLPVLAASLLTPHHDEELHRATA